MGWDGIGEACVHPHVGEFSGRCYNVGLLF